MAEKADVLLIGPSKPTIVNGLATPFTLHKLMDAKNREAFFADMAPRVRALAVAATSEPINGAFMSAVSEARDRCELRCRL